MEKSRKCGEWYSVWWGPRNDSPVRDWSGSAEIVGFCVRGGSRDGIVETHSTSFLGPTNYFSPTHTKQTTHNSNSNILVPPPQKKKDPSNKKK